MEKSKRTKKRVFDTSKEVNKLLASLDLLKESDKYLIEAFCRELDLYHKCMSEVEKEGVVIDFSNGKQEMQQINPHYKAAKIALDNVFKIGKEFGLTTNSRLRLIANMPIIDKDEPKDPIAALRMSSKNGRVKNGG